MRHNGRQRRGGKNREGPDQGDVRDAFRQRRLVGGGSPARSPRRAVISAMTSAIASRVTRRSGGAATVIVSITAPARPRPRGSGRHRTHRRMVIQESTPSHAANDRNS